MSIYSEKSSIFNTTLPLKINLAYFTNDGIIVS